ncbi:unnamed protein product [Rhizoctonia solani]|uniref:HNH nuclease domain-containing protein n=1 Tax=Rhizoctonia solani TaxID=456999 RepID=A0A8H3ECD2_9AGAM|nr:unnamed protein product [Rhizoctonia solani]
MDPNPQTHSPPPDHADSYCNPGCTARSPARSHVLAKSLACSNVLPDSVAKKDENRAPDDELGLITHNPLKPCHLISLATPTEMQEKLEYAWGLETGELTLDTDLNKVWLPHDMYEQFIRDEWALVPSQDLIMEVVMFNADRRPKHFLKSFPNKIWDYRVVRFQPPPIPPVQLTDTPNAPDVIGLDVHPFFVIYNTCQKARCFWDSEEGFHPHSQAKQYINDLALCDMLYASWGRVVLNHHAGQELPDTSYTPSNTRSWTSQSSERQSSRAAKRARRFDVENPPHCGLGMGASIPQNRQHMSASSIAEQYLPTPEQSIDFFSADCEYQPGSSKTSSPTVHWTTVDDWVEGVKHATPSEDPCVGGTKQARQYLDDYESEQPQPPPCGPWEKWISR